jgi:hypothetical protein
MMECMGKIFRRSSVLIQYMVKIFAKICFMYRDMKQIFDLSAIRVKLTKRTIEVSISHGNRTAAPIYSSRVSEVLSQTTEDYDKGRKFDNYRSIDSIREYLLIAQDRPHVMLQVKQPDGKWY